MDFSGCVDAECSLFLVLLLWSICLYLSFMRCLFCGFGQVVDCVGFAFCDCALFYLLDFGWLIWVRIVGLCLWFYFTSGFSGWWCALILLVSGFGLFVWIVF